MNEPSCVSSPSTVNDTAAIDLIHELVATPSVSGEERNAVRAFVRHAEAFGMRTTIDRAGNAHALRGPEAQPNESISEIVLLGHIDTVPGDIAVHLTDGVLHGRGSVDAKGPLCAMLVAAARCDLPDGVCLRVVAAVGEETPDSPGASCLRDAIRPPAACIIGEPSGWDGVTLGYKGRLLVEATTERTLTHTAGPDGTAADAIFHWWSAVRSLVNQHAPDAERVFDRIQSTIRDVHAANDGLIDRATLIAGFRLPLSAAPKDIEQQIRTITPPEIEIAFNGHTSAHATDRTDPVVDALGVGIRAQGARPHPKLKTGTADFNIVGPVWKCPIAAYGPGDSSLDHTPHEHLVIEDYLRSIAVLETALPVLGARLRTSAH